MIPSELAHWQLGDFYLRVRPCTALLSIYGSCEILEECRLFFKPEIHRNQDIISSRSNFKKALLGPYLCGIYIWRLQLFHCIGNELNYSIFTIYKNKP